MVNRFLLELSTDSHSPHTVREYGATIQRWQRSGLSPVDYLATIHVKASTRTMRGIVIRRFLSWCVAHGYESENPLASIRFHAPPAPCVCPFSRAEVEALLFACPAADRHALDRAIILCLLKLGLRASELVSIDSGDLNGDTLTIRGKGGKTRILATTGLLGALRTVCEAGLDYQTLYRRVKAVGHRANVSGCNPHRFRHTFACNCLESGMDVLALQTLLGHSSLSMTQRYVLFGEATRALTAHKRFLES